MKKKQILFVSLGLILLGTYLLFKRSKQNAEPINKEEETINEEELISNKYGIDFSAKTDFDKVLKNGDNNSKEVYILQKGLKQLTIDGDFGDKTEKRLKVVTGLTQISLNKYNEFIKNKK
jgi:hypothetical protein